MAGYVARKSLKKSSCPNCASHLSILPLQAKPNNNASLKKEFDHGGLLYPSKSLENLVAKLENTFTVFFSRHQLHAGAWSVFCIFFSTISSIT